MRYVKYVGPSHQRMILASDWAGVGIQAPTVAWNAMNGFAIPLDIFTEDQIRKAIDNDPMLIITADNEDFTPVYEKRDMTPQEHASGRVDMTDLFDGPEPSTAVSEASGGRPVPDMDDADTRTDADRLPEAGPAKSAKR